LAAEGHDRINVQNNPVNWFDPYGLSGESGPCEALPEPYRTRAFQKANRDCARKGKNYKPGSCYATCGTWGYAVTWECEDEIDCIKVKDECIDKCYKKLERPKKCRSDDSNTWDFHKCLNDCMSKKGC
jgi:hypothetical protein